MSTVFLLLTASGVTYFYSVTKPLNMNSFGSWFGVQFDINARYWVHDNKLEILILKGQVKLRKNSKSAKALDHVALGLSTKSSNSFHISKISNAYDIQTNLIQDNIKYFYLRHFTIPISQSMNLEEHWVTVRGKSYKKGKSVTWYAHGDLDMFRKGEKILELYHKTVHREEIVAKLPSKFRSISHLNSPAYNYLFYHELSDVIRRRALEGALESWKISPSDEEVLEKESVLFTENVFHFGRKEVNQQIIDTHSMITAYKIFLSDPLFHEKNGYKIIQKKMSPLIEIDASAWARILPIPNASVTDELVEKQTSIRIWSKLLWKSDSEIQDATAGAYLGLVKKDYKNMLLGKAICDFYKVELKNNANPVILGNPCIRFASMWLENDLKQNIKDPAVEVAEAVALISFYSDLSRQEKIRKVLYSAQIQAKKSRQAHVEYKLRSKSFNDLGVGEYKQGRYLEAISFFEKAMEKGAEQYDYINFDAYANLGLALLKEGEVEKSIQTLGFAFSHYRNNQARLKADAAFNLGLAYEEKGDLNLAIRYYGLASSYDSTPVHRDKYRSIVKKEKAQYLKELKEKEEAAQDSVEMQYEVGMLYLKAAKYTKANMWLSKAAQNDHMDAQYELAQIYAGARGVPQSNEEAARWYTKAAKQGHAEAQYRLGAMLLTSGQGVARNRVKAKYWFKKAADQGHAYAKTTYDSYFSPEERESGK